jgi:hypothetical protein
MCCMRLSVWRVKDETLRSRRMMFEEGRESNREDHDALKAARGVLKVVARFANGFFGRKPTYT